jgi:hypothetical protein
VEPGEEVLVVVNCDVVIQAITCTTSHTPLLKRAGRQPEGTGTTERQVDCCAEEEDDAHHGASYADATSVSVR